MGYIRKTYEDRAKKYADYVWRNGDTRPSLLEREEVRKLEDTHRGFRGAETGAVFGDLTVLGHAIYVSKTGKPYGWVPYVQCKCGWEGCVHLNNLNRGYSKSCDSCAKKKAGHKRWFKYQSAMPDADHRERLLNRLSAIISRCRCKSCRTYSSYGARGIDVFQGWVDDRASFLTYVATLSGWDDPKLQLDRIDNDGNYEPGNIRFVTCSVNASNKRKANVMSMRIIELEKENAKLREELASIKRQLKSV